MNYIRLPFIMLNFTNLTTNNIKLIAEFLQKNSAYVCDLTVGEKLMWCDYYNVTFAIFNGTLILREDYKEYKQAFHFPIGKNIDGAIKEIINYIKINNEPLYFYCLNELEKNIIYKYFPIIETFNHVEDSDYIYLGESFKTFSGKSLHGQKNHLNHFKKEHPNYSVNEITKEDITKIIEFLYTFEQNITYSKEKINENERCLRIINNYFSFNFNGVVLKENNNILGFAIVEKNDETLIIHIEKAIKSMVGSYQAIVEAYSKLFINDKIKYINREDDAGDEGLKISKQQYHPIELRKKYFFIPRTTFFALENNIFIQTERLIINDWKEEDKEFYFNLVTDDELNKYWGYNYKDDIKDVTIDSIFNIQKEDKINKQEYSLCIRYNNIPIGEFTLWNMDILGGIEFGIRIIKEYHNKGFATECYKNAIKYIKTNNKIKTIYCRCNKLNIPSKTMILKCGFNLYKEDNNYFYFKI